MALDKITDAEMDAQGVIAAPDILEGEPSDVKAIFDRLVRQVVAIAVNQVIDEINAHEADTQNPHSVSQDQVGLGNVDNTADTDKPVSTEQAVALALKANKTNVLEKDNTTEFTPTADYHPAPKKYVDDTAAAATLGQIPDGSLTEEKLNSVVDEKLNGKHTHTKSQITDFPTTFPIALHKTTHSIGGADALISTDLGIDATTAAKYFELFVGTETVDQVLSKLGAAVLLDGSALTDMFGNAVGISANNHGLVFLREIITDSDALQVDIDISDIDWSKYLNIIMEVDAECEMASTIYIRLNNLSASGDYKYSNANGTYSSNSWGSFLSSNSTVTYRARIVLTGGITYPECDLFVAGESIFNRYSYCVNASAKPMATMNLYNSTAPIKAGSTIRIYGVEV